MYAATAPATMVPQNNTLFITAPFAEHLLVLANFRMQNGVLGAAPCAGMFDAADLGLPTSIYTVVADHAGMVEGPIAQLVRAADS